MRHMFCVIFTLLKLFARFFLEYFPFLFFFFANSTRLALKNVVKANRKKKNEGKVKYEKAYKKYRMELYFVQFSVETLWM